MCVHKQGCQLQLAECVGELQHLAEEQHLDAVCAGLYAPLQQAALLGAFLQRAESNQQAAPQ